jgi:ubiquinone/menaquinone biosynthesis C-methylase UbiE
MSNFDDVARTWDENPVHLERSMAIALKMEKMLHLNKKMKALEFGAGTGILSFLLSEKLNQIVMMDNSSEMVRVMEEKIFNQRVTNLFPLWFNLENELPDQSFNLIFSQMVLHHISDIPSIFGKFCHMLLPGGFLAIADLYPEDGSFHGAGFDGHLGFDPEKLKILLEEVGFKNVFFEWCFSMLKDTTDGSSKSFPIFLITASK